VVRERYRRLRSGLVPLGLRIRRLARRAASARRAILQVSPPGVPPGVPPVGRVAVGGGVTCGLPVAASTVPVLLLEVAVVASTLLERTAVVTTDDVLDVDVVWAPKSGAAGDRETRSRKGQSRTNAGCPRLRSWTSSG
jgi:hypothetical protein